MTTRNQQGFVNPFAGQNTRSFGRQAPAAPYGQQQQGFGFQPEQQQEQDERFQAQAYLKIKFHTADGVKTLKWNGKDKPLREASELESMILDLWSQGGDVNQLLDCMELEVVDATPKERGSNSFVPRNGVAEPAPAKAKPRARRQPVQEAEDE
ncbi:MAG: hypothetical protein KIG60_01170 [Caryophanon sp.]|nr:hypothetical protein [Caryophanon sp.]